MKKNGKNVVLTLYGYGSPNVLKVLILLEDLGLPFRFQTVDPFEGQQYSDAFGALNPNRKVPVLVDDDNAAGGQPRIVWESGAILFYLAERHGRFFPKEPAARYNTMQWLMLQMASIGPMFGQLSHFRFYAPQEEHAYSRARYATEVKRLYDVVEVRMGEAAFLGGDDYSIADMAAWPWLRNIAGRGADPAILPHTARWVDTIGVRPAVQRATAFFDPMTNVDLPRVMDEKADAVDRYVLRGRYSRPRL